jgi:hypothetical protein
MSKGLNTWFDNFGTVPEQVPVAMKAEAQAGGSRRRKRRGSRKTKRRGGSRRRKYSRKH